LWMPWIKYGRKKSNGVRKIKDNKRTTGTKYEQRARAFLEENGVKILEQNFRNRFGEIDLIGRDGEYLVFFEVKYRKDDKCGSPAEAVTYQKQKTICKVSDFYRVKMGIGEFSPMRYDVISICGEELHWIKNAFDYRY